MSKITYLGFGLYTQRFEICFTYEINL